MKVYIGSDHAGYDNKEYVKLILKELNIPYKDLCENYDKKDDYPLVAKTVARKVVEDKTKGILLCGTGIGISIAANKIRGIRAALVYDVYGAEKSREDNDANILALSGRLSKSKIKPILMEWFTQKPSKAKKHVRRRNQIE